MPIKLELLPTARAGQTDWYRERWDFVIYICGQTHFSRFSKTCFRPIHSASLCDSRSNRQVSNMEKKMARCLSLLRTDWDPLDTLRGTWYFWDSWQGGHCMGSGYSHWWALQFCGRYFTLSLCSRWWLMLASRNAGKLSTGTGSLFGSGFPHCPASAQCYIYHQPAQRLHITFITNEYNLCAGTWRRNSQNKTLHVYTIHHIFNTCVELHASWVLAHRAHQSPESPASAQKYTVPLSTSLVNMLRAPRSMEFWKIFWECLYTKKCGTEELYCMFYPQFVPVKLAVHILVLFVVIARKRGEAGTHFVPKDPHQIDRTLYQWCTKNWKVIVGLANSLTLLMKWTYSFWQPNWRTANLHSLWPPTMPGCS